MPSHKNNHSFTTSPTKILNFVFILNIICILGVTLITWQLNHEIQNALIGSIQCVDIVNEVDSTPPLTGLVKEIILEETPEDISRYETEVEFIQSRIKRLQACTFCPEVALVADGWLKTSTKQIELQSQALALSQEGNTEEALEIINGLEYTEVESRFSDQLTNTKKVSEEIFITSKSYIQYSINLIIVTMLFVIVTIIVVWVMTLKALTKHLAKREKNFDELKELSERDSLTSLYNRHGFFSVGNFLWRQSHREDSKLVIIFCDLDDLKEINDQYGHEEGDKAIKHFAEILRSTFRDSDIVSRIGGDEFVIVAECQTNEKCENHTGRILQNLKAHNQQSNEPYDLKMSMGFLLCHPNEMSLRAAMAEADKLMYKQKKIKNTSS